MKIPVRISNIPAPDSCLRQDYDVCLNFFAVNIDIPILCTRLLERSTEKIHHCD